MIFAKPFFALLMATALILLFLLFRPDDISPSAIDNAEVTPEIEQSAPTIYKVTLTNGHLTAGPALISATQGEEITIDFVSDRQAELHLHGYDLTLRLNASENARLNFTANHAGRFEYELHGHAGGHNALGAIEVYPR